MAEDTIAVRRSAFVADMAELTELRKRDKILQALEAAGVDNWDGYDDAVSSVEEQ